MCNIQVAFSTEYLAIHRFMTVQSAAYAMTTQIYFHMYSNKETKPQKTVLLQLPEFWQLQISAAVPPTGEMKNYEKRVDVLYNIFYSTH